MKKTLTIIGLAVATLTGGQAQVIFSQNFSSSTTLSTYINLTTPNSGQWNAISTSGAGTTISVASNNLSFTRTANAGTFSRTTNFSPIPLGIIYKFDLSVSGNSANTTSAAVWQVGSGFTTNNSAEANADTYARLALNLTNVNGTFVIRDITNGTNSVSLSGTQGLMWVLNNTGSLLSYTNPNGGTSTVANDTADLWAGTTALFNDVAIQTPAQTISDLKFAFTAGSATVTMDNFEITAIPEPTTWTLIGLGSAFMLWNVRRRRSVQA